MEPRPAVDSRTQLVRWMTIADANNAGNVHGGVIMQQCDQAAGLAAIKHSRCRVVTAAMDRMTFLVAVRVGDLVTFSATINAVWRTSMEVGVSVSAENPREGVTRDTSMAYLTMVALDDEGNPTAVPPLLLESEDEHRREREAQRRRRERLEERDRILAERGLE